MFPLIKSKGLRLELSYEDSLVGKVTIDGDVDMKSALTAFSEEEDLSFRTIFVAECMKPDVEAQCSRAFNDPPPAKKRKASYISSFYSIYLFFVIVFLITISYYILLYNTMLLYLLCRWMYIHQFCQLT